MTIKLVLAIPELDAGGPDRVIYELLTGLDRTRFTPVLVVSKPGGRYYNALPGDIQIEVVEDGRYPIRSFAKAVDYLAPDLVFTTLRMNVTAIAGRFLQRRKVPLIIRQANAIAADFAVLQQQSLVKHRLARRIVSWLVRRADAIVAQSADMAQEMRASLRRGQDLVVIGNPVSIGEVEDALASQRSTGQTEPFGNPAIVAVGRLAPQKGFDLLLEAFATFLKEQPGAKLTIWGEGSDRDAIETQAQILGIQNKVRLPGHSANVLAEIAASDIFVSSSRYEGFSNAMLEAMALAVPVVATDCPGATKDMIRDGETGILISAINANGIRLGLERVMEVDRAALGKRGRDHVAHKFDKVSIVRQYEELFERHAVRQAPEG